MPPSPRRRDDAPTLRELKQSMRRRVLALRNAIPAEAHASDSMRIAERLAATPAFERAATVCLTLPFGSEWDVRPLVERALARGTTVVLPRVDAEAKMLVLHAVRDLEADVAPGFRAIPEPSHGTPVVVPEAIDCVLLPGVAFDRAGRRLGYGGGYYDRLLPLFRPGVARLAGAFAEQLVDEVPAAAHDLRVDVIATPDELIRAAGP